LCGATKTVATNGRKLSHFGGELQTLRWLCYRIARTHFILNTRKPFTACWRTFFWGLATDPSRRKKLAEH
jgi:hypothetical protein